MRPGTQLPPRRDHRWVHLDPCRADVRPAGRRHGWLESGGPEVRARSAAQSCAGHECTMSKGRPADGDRREPPAAAPGWRPATL